ncbi:MAG: hypothetical protein K9G48_00615 [Reyranella sp.]|nr:hypothetical protein [Reyranella sp.]
MAGNSDEPVSRRRMIGRSRGDGADKEVKKEDSPPVGEPEPVLTVGIDIAARRNFAYVLLALSVVMIMGAVVPMLLNLDIPIRALGIPFCIGLTIIFAGFLGATARWDIKATGLSIVGSAAVFFAVYKFFFLDVTNSECAYSVKCHAPRIALQFARTIDGELSSAAIMRCFRVMANGSAAQRVELQPLGGVSAVGDLDKASQTVDANNYFLIKGQSGDIEVFPNQVQDQECQQSMKEVRMTDPVGYRLKRFGHQPPQNEGHVFSVTPVDGSAAFTLRYDQFIKIIVHLSPVASTTKVTTENKR